MNSSRLGVTIIVLTFLLISYHQAVHGQMAQTPSGPPTPGNLSAKQWQEDIDYLTKKLEIMHPNLYAQVSKVEFAGYVDDLRKKVGTSTEHEIIIGIHELLAHVRNLHTFCNPVLYLKDRQGLDETYQYYPVRFYPFEDGLFVLSIHKKYERALGKKVIKIGNLTALETMNRLARFIPADNAMSTLNYMPRGFLNDGPLLKYIGASDSEDQVTLLLADSDGSEVEYTIETEPGVGKTFVKPFIIVAPEVVTMNRQSTNPVPLYLRHTLEPYWFEYIPVQNAIYLQINQLRHKDDETFDQFCQRMFDSLDQHQAERLIIDLRLNTGGNHVELPLLKGILNRPRLDNPDCLFLLIGRTTVSAAQHLTSEMVWYTNATLLGEPTCSKPNQYGAIRWFNLPNSKLQIACAIDYYQDAQPYDFSVQTEPDFFIRLTSSDFLENRDPVMEAVLQYNSHRTLRREFAQTLANAYTNEGLEGMKKAYYQIKPGYDRFGYNMENLLYDDLDPWISMNKRNTEDYIGFLKFVYQEIPTSLKVIWDLGVWMKRIDREEAKKYFNRCLELNPEHHYAKMELQLLELEKMPPAR